MKSTVTLEEIKDYVEQNNITKPSQLHKENSSYYNFLSNRRIMKEVFPNAQFHSNHKCESMLEEVLQYIKDNNITKPSQLHKEHSRYYNFLNNRRLMKEAFPNAQFYSKNKGETRLEEVLQYIKDNNITTRTELQKSNNGMYMVLYFNNMLEEVFGAKQTGKRRGNKISVPKEPKEHKKRYHGNGMPLTALLVEFLIRWSKEEGVNMEVETRKYGYWTQWREWCKENNLDINTGERLDTK